MELELKHLAPYLPHRLMCEVENEIKELQGLEFGYPSRSHLAMFNEFGEIGVDKVKPVLHPLSDLTKEIEHNGETFIPVERLVGEDKDDVMLMWIQGVHAVYSRFDYMISYYNKLLEWHFDTAGLIDAGLAVDINTLKH